MALLRPLLMQASGADATFSYTAQEHRALVAATMSEGIIGTGDFLVTQRALGANFTVDVAAGKAVIVGDSVANQGSYLVTNDAPLLGTVIPAAPASGTRVHRVILKVQDKAHDGAVATNTYNAVVQVLEDTGTGTPALPASAITLATVSVAAGQVSILNANITSGRSVSRSPSMPWGRVFHATPGTSGVFTTLTTYSNASFDTVLGRRYRISVMARFFVTTAGVQTVYSILTAGASTYGEVPQSVRDAVGGQCSVAYEWTYDATATGPTTWALAGRTDGTGAVRHEATGSIIIEDIGPV